MTVIRPNSISGVTSITAHGGDITYFKSDGTRGNQFTHNIQSTGVITATTFVGNLTGNPTGSGANLTNLPAANLTGTLPAISAANLTNLPAANLTGTLPAIDGSALTGVGASFGNSSVNTSGIITATSFVPTTGQLSHRNIIINGAMMISQRGTSSTSSGMKTVDRFLCQFGGTDEALTQSQHTLTSSDTGPYEEGFIKSFHIQNGNQTSGAGAADFVEIYTVLEDQDISTSGWNYKSSSSYITISFWVKSSVAQKFPGFLYTNQAAAGDSYMYSYQIDNGSGGNLTANTWTKITHSIPGNTSLSFNNDNTRGLSIAFFPFNGTDTSTSDHTDGAWAAWSTSNKIKDMTSTWYTTNDATFEITGVQLEVGPVATPFEHRSHHDYLNSCQRYFHQIKGNDNDIVAFGFAQSSSNNYFNIEFPVPMRDYPTFTGSATAARFTSANNGQDFNLDSLAISSNPTHPYPSRVTLYVNQGGTNGGYGGALTPQNAEGTLSFSAEL